MEIDTLGDVNVIFAKSQFLNAPGSGDKKIEYRTVGFKDLRIVRLFVDRSILRCFDVLSFSILKPIHEEGRQEGKWLQRCSE